MKFFLNAKENGITLLILIITIVVMLILAGVTTQSIKKYKAVGIPNVIVEYSKNTISDTDQEIQNIQNGNWMNIINKKGIENQVGER